MLMYALYVLALMITISSSILTLAFVSAKTTGYHRVAAYLQMGYLRGVADAQRSLAGSSKLLDPTTGLWSAPDPSALNNLPSTKFTVGPYTVTDVVVPKSTLGGNSTQAGYEQTPNDQFAAQVNESRASIQIGVTVTVNSNVIAQRTSDVTLRLFAQGPFSAIAGVKEDPSADPASIGDSAQEGDSGGDPGNASAGPALSTNSNTTVLPGDTRYHLLFACHGSNATDCGFSHPPPDQSVTATGKSFGNGTSLQTLPWINRNVGPNGFPR
jgi:hypothetical protein